MSYKRSLHFSVRSLTFYLLCGLLLQTNTHLRIYLKSYNHSGVVRHSASMAQFGAHERSQTFPSSNHLGSQALGRIPSNQSYIDLGSSSIYSINTYILPEPISYTHRLRTRSSPAAAVRSLELSFPRSSTGYIAGNKGPLGPFSAENRSHTSCASEESVSREDTDTFE